MTTRIAVLVLCAGIAACDPRLPVGPDVFVDYDAIDSPTSPLSEAGKQAMNGIYEVVDGQNKLGTVVAGEWHGNRWRLFAQHDVVFSESAGGSLGDSIKLMGSMRAVRSGSGTRIRLTIGRRDGATEIVAGSPPAGIRILGSTEDGQRLELRRIRNLNRRPFHVLAHRGGGRNSDRLGKSENSIAMIIYADILGATGIEVDVKRTRDNQLILFHDDTFSPRTVQGAYLLGTVEDFDLEQITALGRLVNGEEIPTLRQALTAVIDKTDLSLVWLDIKDPAAVPQVVQIQQEMHAYAAQQGRDSLLILLGVPTQEVLDAYKPYQHVSDALIELEDARIALTYPRCRAWAPSWTLAITPERVSDMRAAGRMVFTWTVDIRESIADYMQRIDGILSNYPTLVASIHAARD